MFTVNKKKAADPKDVFALRVERKVAERLLYHYRSNGFEIYDPMREFLGDVLLPALDEAERKQDAELEKRAKELEADVVPILSTPKV